MLTDTKKSPYARLYSLPCEDISWTGGIYKERFDTCAEVTVPHLQKMFESADISHVVENFRIAAGESEGEFDGTVFGDGDFYKWMEAAMYTAVKKGSREMTEQLEKYVELIGRAQLEDGYISTKQIIGEKNGTGAGRLGDINDFEVYNFGHLFTAACLYKRLTGRDSFLKIAGKAAGYLENLYEEAERTKEVQTAVCPSHYMGLIEMYRTTGEQRYLDLARTAIRLRDSVENGLDDNQDRIPVKEHEKIVGHAVRANYLYAGLADLCMEEDDEEYREVLHKVWKSLVTQKMYITGGCGALYNGASPYGNFFVHQIVHQAYGYEYQLPNVTAYNETCASLGGVFWAWRMFCMEGKAEYVDVMERMMLNVNLAGISLDGRRFFYENMLRRAKELPYELIWGQERASYILSYCCPPNLARTIAESSEYAYALDEEGVWMGLYGENTAHIQLKSGTRFTLSQKTDYPWEGRIAFEIEDVQDFHPFTLHLRIPGWVRRGKLALGEIKKEISRKEAGTYIDVRIEKPDPACVLLELDMPARLTCGHALIEEDNGHVAVERGPLVYCLESCDVHEAGSLAELVIPSDAEFETEDILIEGRSIRSLNSVFLKLKQREYDEDALYQDFLFDGYDKVRVKLIPYFAWDNRGRGEMMVWMPVSCRQEV